MPLNRKKSIVLTMSRPIVYMGIPSPPPPMQPEIRYRYILLFPLSWIPHSIDCSPVGHQSVPVKPNYDIPYTSLHHSETIMIARTPFKTRDLRKHVVEGYFRTFSVDNK